VTFGAKQTSRDKQRASRRHTRVSRYERSRIWNDRWRPEEVAGRSKLRVVSGDCPKESLIGTAPSSCLRIGNKQGPTQGQLDRARPAGAPDASRSRQPGPPLPPTGFPGTCLERSGHACGHGTVVRGGSLSRLANRPATRKTGPAMLGLVRLTVFCDRRLDRTRSCGRHLSTPRR
jgi:hypothetical protein